jgi:predicted nucleic acid-binding protein
VHYGDTSALLKLYAPEPDSPFFLQLLARTDEQIFTASVAAVEIQCALHRKEHFGDLKPGGAAAAIECYREDIRCGRVIEIPFGRDVLEEASNLINLAFRRKRRILIRSLDIIHLASAKAAGVRLMIATDARLREVASLVELRLLP